MSLRDLEQAIDALGDTDAAQERHRRVLRQIHAELSRLEAEVDKIKARTTLPAFDERRMAFADACQDYVTVKALNEKLEEGRNNPITVRIEPTITINDNTRGGE